MSSKKVRVAANATTGAVVNVSENNPQYGWVKLEQKRPFIDDNGFLKPRTITTLIQGLVVDLQDEEYFAGKELDGNIQVKESMDPFSKKYPENDIKKAGETGIVLTVKGAPIYRKTVYDPTGSKSDELVQHDNKAELRAAYDAQNASAIGSDNFSIGG